MLSPFTRWRRFFLQQLGWELDKLLTMTIQAMAANEDLINEEFEEYRG